MVRVRRTRGWERPRQVLCDMHTTDRQAKTDGNFRASAACMHACMCETTCIVVHIYFWGCPVAQYHTAAHADLYGTMAPHLLCTLPIIDDRGAAFPEDRSLSGFRARVLPTWMMVLCSPPLRPRPRNAETDPTDPTVGQSGKPTQRSFNGRRRMTQDHDIHA